MFLTILTAYCLWYNSNESIEKITQRENNVKGLKSIAIYQKNHKKVQKYVLIHAEITESLNM